MLDIAYSKIPESDLVLFMIDASKSKKTEAETKIIESLKKSNKKAILLINKVDIVKKEKILGIIDEYKDEYKFEDIIPISTVKSSNIEVLKKRIVDLLPVGPKYYDDDEYTLQTEKEIVSEIIRGKLLLRLNEEIPHGIYVEVEEFKERKKSNGIDYITDVLANIYVLRPSHKAIAIGKDGDVLKHVGTSARLDIESVLGKKINLKLLVKVKEKWIDNESFIKKFE
jgi:GTP-binding protein Era